MQTTNNKEPLRYDINRQIDEFFAKGKEIKQVDSSVMQKEGKTMKEHNDSTYRLARIKG